VSIEFSGPALAAQDGDPVEGDAELGAVRGRAVA
jgi:hypothetical protein